MANALFIDAIVRERILCYDNSSSQLSENIVYHKVGTVVGGVSDADMAAAKAQFHATAYKGWMSQQSSYVGVGIQIIGPPPVRYAEVINTNFTGVGTAGSQQLPTQVSGMIKWTTGTLIAGPSGKFKVPTGRIYPGFPALVWSDPNGFMTPAAKNQLGVIAATFPLTTTIVSATGEAQITMVLKVTNAIGYVNITGISWNGLWATQRRRGDRGKPNLAPV